MYNTKVMLSLVRNLDPRVVAEQLISVQPMDEASMFAMTTGTQERHPRQGELRHSFIHGWQRYYGTEWIGTDIWVKLKVKGL